MLRDRASPASRRVPYGRLMRWRTAVTGSVAGAGLYLGVATGRVSVDIGVGRRKRALGPIELDVAAPRAVVFDVISEPYRGRTPRAMAGKLRVLERAGDLVLAEHTTPIGGGLTAITVETVRFVPPERVEFRLVRGPVPAVSESFELTDEHGHTRLRYAGELETDLGSVGALWGRLVARRWIAAVDGSLRSIKDEAERRARVGRP